MITTLLKSQIPANAAVLEKVCNWDLEPIKNYILEKGLLPVDRVDGIVKQYQLYMYLRIVENFRAPMSCADIDTVWHAHLLHTQNYREFCHAICGGFIDHTPHAHKHYCENGCPDLLTMEALYNEHFGDLGFWGGEVTICW